MFHVVVCVFIFEHECDKNDVKVTRMENSCLHKYPYSTDLEVMQGGQLLGARTEIRIQCP